MLMYVLIGLSLVLTGVAGLQFTYLFYVDRVLRDRKSHLRQIESERRALAYELEAANKLIAEQKALIDEAYPAIGREEDWADVIEER